MKIKYFITTLLSIGVAMSSFAQESYNYVGIAYDNVGNGNNEYTTVQNTSLNGAYLNLPNGLCLDTNKRIYFTHFNRIMLIDGSTLRGRAGGAGDPTFSSGYKDLAGINGRFDDPRGIAVDPNTNEVYTCDFGNQLIRKMSPFVNASNAQTNSTFAGTYLTAGSTDGPLTSARFNGPNDIVVMNNGDIYISEEDNNTIRKISGGMVSTVAGSASAFGDVDGVGTAARFKYPRGLYIQDQNTLLIADFGNGKIRRMDLTTNTVSTVVSGLTGPQDMVYVDGVIYYAERTKISTFENGTSTLYAGSGFYADTTYGTLANTRFTDIRKMTYHPDENALYIADYRFGIIKKIELFDAPKVDFTATPTAASVNQVVTITDNTTNRKGTKVWQITPSTYTLVNGSTLTSETLMLEFSQTGTFNVKLTYNYPGGTQNKEKTGYINVSNISAVPVADFVADFVSQKPNTNITLIDLSNNNPSSRLWTITPSAGVTYQNSTSNSSKFPVLQFANEGKYTVKLTATNAQGSDDEVKTDYIEIDKNSINVNTHTKSAIAVYPNPAEAVISFSGVNNASSFVIYNTFGQEVLSDNINGNTIDVSKLNAGIYSVLIKDTEGNIYQSKIVKQ